jgi:hypothetical protein
MVAYGRRRAQCKPSCLGGGYAPAADRHDQDRPAQAMEGAGPAAGRRGHFEAREPLRVRVRALGGLTSEEAAAGGFRPRVRYCRARPATREAKAERYQGWGPDPGA